MDKSRTDEFEFTLQFVAPQGDLQTVQLVAQFGNQQLTLWSAPASGYSFTGTGIFTVPTEGDWSVFAVVQTGAGRVVQSPLQPVGGGAAITLLIRDSDSDIGSTVCANPTLSSSPVGGNRNMVTLSCSTPGATIFFAITATGNATPSTSSTGRGGWMVYSTAVTVPAGKTVYAYAIASGLTASAVISASF